MREPTRASIEDAPRSRTASTAADHAAVAARQERAAERLLDDERLRGDLTDDEFQPLQGWALRAADRLALGTLGCSDADADAIVDAGLGQVREAVEAAGAAVSAMLERGQAGRNAELHPLRDVARPPLIQLEAAHAGTARLTAALDRIMADSKLEGIELAQAIADALGTLWAESSGEGTAVR